MYILPMDQQVETDRRSGQERRMGSPLNSALPFLTRHGLIFRDRRRIPDRRRSALSSY
jgi:hypothetical protein